MVEGSFYVVLVEVADITKFGTITKVRKMSIGCTNKSDKLQKYALECIKLMFLSLVFLQIMNNFAFP